MDSTLDREGGGPFERLRAGARLQDASLGALICLECGYAVSTETVEAVPPCPACGGLEYRRAPMFERSTSPVEVVEASAEAPEWVEQARAKATSGAPYLGYRYGGETRVLELAPGWIRIGRSATADLRLDDATVSRRHALIVLSERGELRALDDRSLNGLFVNGERVESAIVTDGDELEIGRYRVVVLT